MILSDTPVRYASAAPRHGEHTAAVLAELGLKPAEIERLARAGVIQLPARKDANA